jgi:hypothetical protein
MNPHSINLAARVLPWFVNSLRSTNPPLCCRCARVLDGVVDRFLRQEAKVEALRLQVADDVTSAWQASTPRHRDKYGLGVGRDKASSKIECLREPEFARMCCCVVVWWLHSS